MFTIYYYFAFDKMNFRLIFFRSDIVVRWLRNQTDISFARWRSLMQNRFKLIGPGLLLPDLMAVRAFSNTHNQSALKFTFKFISIERIKSETLNNIKHRIIISEYAK